MSCVSLNDGSPPAGKNHIRILLRTRLFFTLYRIALAPTRKTYQISFEILRSVHICVTGTKTPFLKNADFLDDFSVDVRNADIL